MRFSAEFESIHRTQYDVCLHKNHRIMQHTCTRTQEHLNRNQTNDKALKIISVTRVCVFLSSFHFQNDAVFFLSSGQYFVPCLLRASV